MQQYLKYHSTSYCLQLRKEEDENERIKIYNKTLHPLFAPESVQKKIGMGGKAFFLSSTFFHNAFKDTDTTGRLRVEHSHYLKSINEESEFLRSAENSSPLIEEIAIHIRKHGRDHVREVSFGNVWNSFWYSAKPHYVFWDANKAAIVYGYNEESNQYIGGLIDISPKRDQMEFIKKYSIQGRELILVENEEIKAKYVKTTNLHCFPIFPGST